MSAFADEVFSIMDRQKELIEQQQNLIHDLGEIIKTYGPPRIINFDNKQTPEVK